MLLFIYSLPDGFGDDLIVEVQDSKGKYCGHALVQVADIADESVLCLNPTFDCFLLLKPIFVSEGVKFCCLR